MTTTRYAIELDCYLWADSDEQARKIAKELAKLLRSYDDNEARVKSLVEQPHGTIYSREIEL